MWESSLVLDGVIGTPSLRKQFLRMQDWGEKIINMCMNVSSRNGFSKYLVRLTCLEE